MEFRLLRPEDIDVRVQQVTAKGAVLLLYKDARCDMNILDETIGAENWQRDHKELKGNIYCGVSIFNKDAGIWVTKWDCGKESQTEGEKGEASDSFKRACFNWGIGRELYTSPFVWVNLEATEIQQNNGRNTLKKGISFSVAEIASVDKKISKLTIIDNRGVVRFSFNNGKADSDINSQEFNAFMQKMKDGTMPDTSAGKSGDIDIKSTIADLEKQFKDGTLKKAKFEQWKKYLDSVYEKAKNG